MSNDIDRANQSNDDQQLGDDELEEVSGGDPSVPAGHTVFWPTDDKLQIPPEISYDVL